MKLDIGNDMINRRLGSDWTTMDIIKGKNVDIVHDLRKIPYPFKNNSVELIYMSHVLEHIPWTITDKVLKELYRITQKNGVIEVFVPDLKKLVQGYLNNDLIKNDGWYKYNPDKNPVRWFNGRLFTYGPGEENFHKAAFDFEFLSHCLEKAGFKQIERLEKPRGYNHGWINLGVKGVK